VLEIMSDSVYVSFSIVKTNKKKSKKHDCMQKKQECLYTYFSV